MTRRLHIHRIRAARGAAAVEFALISFIFFSLIAGVFDFSYLLFIDLTMQHAVREGARVAAVHGNYTSAIDRMRAQSMGLWTILSPTVSIAIVNANGSLTPLPSKSAGTSSDIIVVTVNCSSTLMTGFIAAFFPGGIYKFSVSTTIRNE
jgi:Flp pilus assembly protein TadG